ncbi:g11271 [Coccomyxa elongata]
MAMQRGRGAGEKWDVFHSHAGEQKKDFVDVMHTLLTMILLEDKTQPNKALFPVFYGYDVEQCWDFKAFRALYDTEPWVGGEEKPDDCMLDAWARSVEELCQYCGVRQDQARHYQGQLAKLAVEGVVECLISIGQLPQGYSPKQVIPCFLARKTPILFGREEELAWLRGRLCAPTEKFPAAVIRGGCGDGKSALAMELGMQMYEAGEIPRGAYLIDLAGRYSPAISC